MVLFYWSYTAFVLLKEPDLYHFNEYSSNCGKEYTNYFDNEKYSKQYCEIYNVTIENSCLLCEYIVK